MRELWAKCFGYSVSNQIFHISQYRPTCSFVLPHTELKLRCVTNNWIYDMFDNTSDLPHYICSIIIGDQSPLCHTYVMTVFVSSTGTNNCVRRWILPSQPGIWFIDRLKDTTTVEYDPVTSEVLLAAYIHGDVHWLYRVYPSCRISD